MNATPEHRFWYINPTKQAVSNVTVTDSYNSNATAINPTGTYSLLPIVINWVNGRRLPSSRHRSQARYKDDAPVFKWHAPGHDHYIERRVRLRGRNRSAGTNCFIYVDAGDTGYLANLIGIIQDTSDISDLDMTLNYVSYGR